MGEIVELGEIVEVGEDLVVDRGGEGRRLLR